MIADEIRAAQKEVIRLQDDLLALYRAEQERLRTENAGLKALVAKYDQIVKVHEARWGVLTTLYR